MTMTSNIGMRELADKELDAVCGGGASERETFGLPRNKSLW